MELAKLYIVPTPIGNLADMTFRAVEVLKSVDIILAEDTRQSKKLLDHYNIKNKVYSHHKFNERTSTNEIITKLQAGQSVALISDAGTPLISDPGSIIVSECITHNIAVECLPGATSLIPSLVLSGFSTDRFCFEGFLPVKKGRKTRLEELVEEKRTMIFFESPHKLLKTLQDFANYFGKNRQITACRELTKFYEEVVRGSVDEVIQYFTKKGVKGEFVLVVHGYEK